MTYCDFQRIEQTNDYRCVREGCGRIIRDVAQLPIWAACANQDLPETPRPAAPAGWQKVLNFAKAAFNQAPLVAEAILTGDEAKAFRSQAEIEAIANICKSCPLFNGSICTHGDCGCSIDAERNAWWSKIAWRSQSCPDDPPRW